MHNGQSFRRGCLNRVKIDNFFIFIFYYMACFQGHQRPRNVQLLCDVLGGRGREFKQTVQRYGATKLLLDKRRVPKKHEYT